MDSSIVLEIEKRIARFSPSALTAALWYFEQHIPKKDEGLVAKVEYVALLLLERFAHDRGETPKFEDVAALSAELDKIFDVSKYMVRSHIEQDKETLRSRMVGFGLAIRNPVVPQLWTQLLKTFATEHDPRIERFLPYSLTQGIAITESYLNLLGDRATAWQTEQSRRMQKLKRALSQQKFSGLSIQDRKIVDQVQAAARPKRKNLLRSLCWHEALATFPSCCFVDCRVLSEACSVEPDTIESFLRDFTVSTHIPKDYRLFPSPFNALSMTPFIATPSGYFAPHPALLQWALLPRIEEILKRYDAVHETKSFQSYERSRKRFTEDSTRSVFARVCDNVSTNVEYRHAGKHGEIDLIARYDNTTYIVECKASTIPPAARRGAPKSIQDKLRSILRVAVAQLTQVERAIEARAIPLENCDDLIPVVVMLDHAEPYAVAAEALRNEGIYKRPTWFIALTSLLMLVELLETSWRFKHYCRRRLLVDEKHPALALAEDDYYQAYIAMNVCAMPRFGETAVYLKLRTDVSDYYFDLAAGKKTSKPQAPKFTRLEKLYADLESSKAIGRSEVICDLLDIPFKAQKNIDQALARTASQICDGGLSIFAFPYNIADCGIMFAVANAFPLRDAVTLAQLQASEITRVTRWLAVAHDPQSGEVAFRYFLRDQSERSNMAPGFRLGERALVPGSGLLKKLERHAKKRADRTAKDASSGTS